MDTARLGPTSAPATAQPATSTALPGASGYAEIDLTAITDNVAALRGRVGSAEVMAVVKADGYGHGALPSARAALAGGATWIGVAQLAEALAVRAAGITAPILSWLYVPGADLSSAVLADIDLTVSNLWSLNEAAAGAARHGKPARVHLKVDTGLARNGAFGDDFADLVRAAARVAATGAIEVVGVWSHFAYADAPQHPTVRAQQEVFDEAAALMVREGIPPSLRHLANSAATLTNPGAYYDLVRPGIAVYGLSPTPDLASSADFGLREAMRLVARVAQVKDVPAGQGVSYGHTYVTERPTRLALVPLGYADGIPRHASNAGPVLAAGHRRTIAGRVCMDQFVLDLGPDAPVALGDEVVVFGSAERGEPTAEDWAVACGTISYEIVTRVGTRLPRVYLTQAR